MDPSFFQPPREHKAPLRCATDGSTWTGMFWLLLFVDAICDFLWFSRWESSRDGWERDIELSSLCKQVDNQHSDVELPARGPLIPSSRPPTKSLLINGEIGRSHYSQAGLTRWQGNERMGWWGSISFSCTSQSEAVRRLLVALVVRNVSSDARKLCLFA